MFDPAARIHPFLQTIIVDQCDVQCDNVQQGVALESLASSPFSPAHPVGVGLAGFLCLGRICFVFFRFRVRSVTGSLQQTAQGCICRHNPAMIHPTCC